MGFLAAVVTMSALAGCGGGTGNTVTKVIATTAPAGAGTRLFSAPSFAIHFRFPAAFRVRRTSKRVTGKGAAAVVAVGPYDGLFIYRFHLRLAVTAQHIDEVKAETDRALSATSGQLLSSTPGTVGGRPALSYPPFPVKGLPVAVTDRITDVFVGADEYELNCQYTAGHAQTIVRACNDMLATLTISP